MVAFATDDEAWDFAAKRAKESGGMFLSLKNDNDKTVGVFVGRPHVVDNWYNKDTKEYEDYTDAHKAKGLTPSSRFKLNVWVRAEKVCRVWEINGMTFQDVMAARSKYGSSQFAFEITRHGAAGNTKTSYTILPETNPPLSKEELESIKNAKLHDLALDPGGNSSATDMDSHDKKTNGAGAPGGTGSPGTALVDPDTKTRLAQRLKQHPKDKIDGFIAHFKIRKMGELTMGQVAAADALLDSYEGKPAAAAGVHDDTFD